MSCTTNYHAQCDFIDAWQCHVRFTHKCPRDVDCPNFLLSEVEVKKHMVTHHREMMATVPAKPSGRGDSRVNQGRPGAKVNNKPVDVRVNQGPKNPDPRRNDRKNVGPARNNTNNRSGFKEQSDDWNEPVISQPAQVNDGSAWESHSGMSSKVEPEAVPYDFNLHCMFMENIHPPVLFQGMSINRVGCSCLKAENDKFCAKHRALTDERKIKKAEKAASIAAAKEAKAAKMAAATQEKVGVVVTEDGN